MLADYLAIALARVVGMTQFSAFTFVGPLQPPTTSLSRKSKRASPQINVALNFHEEVKRKFAEAEQTQSDRRLATAALLTQRH